MKSLQKKLQEELQQQADGTIVESREWELPVRIVEVSYTTVKRTTMDVLMKMILLSIERIPIHEDEELARILAVEPLFVQNIMSRLTRTNMVERRGSAYQLTQWGRDRLKLNTFVHPPEQASKWLCFSPVHNEFLLGSQAELAAGKLEPYRYNEPDKSLQVEDLDRQMVWEALRESGAEFEEGNVQVVLEDVQSVKEAEKQKVPCMEFILHNETEDTFYARVWNSWTGCWDEKLETELADRELQEWRKKYTEK